MLSLVLLISKRVHERKNFFSVSLAFFISFLFFFLLMEDDLRCTDTEDMRFMEAEMSRTKKRRRREMLAHVPPCASDPLYDRLAKWCDAADWEGRTICNAATDCIDKWDRKVTQLDYSSALAIAEQRSFLESKWKQAHLLEERMFVQRGKHHLESVLLGRGTSHEDTLLLHALARTKRRIQRNLAHICDCELITVLACSK